MTQRHWLSILDVLHGDIWALPPPPNVRQESSRRNESDEHAGHMQFQSTAARQMYGQYDRHSSKREHAIACRSRAFFRRVIGIM